ncbi:MULTISPECIES: LuxR C-terminal-related transcriptional regulator [unclassified Rhodococcus (in: high G+C Gram-positive bacteria)]|uniref:LuxR C-terminal-related transcriptional regulator n=1 Tax=unclassified Rhodococcus (in: high G+C Gram-positive bacteria) TaxID=192944 RepID=UPI001639AD1D|nr:MULTISPECIES: LuxR C-terminal-related transcriptional regulator [unclassified Rhodococcus (in: high G+C Gram-positive bacteria)]MBC2641577.1 LuxR family transcriptional regulator [Rhodococcus sp. 3A]MBC2893678.1 LuxR family transcriptional regulator [Rhodococcus sp. 4CII]
MLTEALTDEARPYPVALVCAPAGSGKTRAVADWARELLAADDAPTIAWFTIEERHNDLDVVHRAILRALADTGNPRLQSACAGLDSESPGLGAKLSAALHDLGENVWMIIDDAHLLRDTDVLTDLESFMRWQPPMLRTVIIGRFEPPLALQRLRLDGKLFTLTATDLAFTSDEAAAMLDEHGVVLRPDDLDALMDRTEGWAAGIRLAGMSLEGHPDPSGLIAEFTGDRRAVADYLIEEVLAGQTDEMREFLLRTSVPASFTVELAEKLTGCPDAHGNIDWLEHHNFLISRITENPTQYRYHPLLRSYLRAEISRIGHVEVEHLELTAAHWHDEFGDALPALEHAVNSGDHDEIVALLARTSMALIVGGHGQAVDRLLTRAPRASQDHPSARLLRAAAALASGNVQVAASTLDLLDRRRSGLLVDGAAESRVHLLLRESLRVQTAIRIGDIDTALTRLRRVGAGSSGDPDLDAFVLLQEGRALLFLGRHDESEIVLRKSLAHARLGDTPLSVMYCLGTLGAVTMSRGEVLGTSELVDEALAIGRAQSATSDPTFLMTKLIDSWCRYIRMDPDAARIAAESAEALRRTDTAAAGFADGAAALFGLDEAEHRHNSVTTVHADSPVSASLPVPPGIRAVLLPAIQYAYLSAGEIGWAHELATETPAVLGPTGDTPLVEAIIHLHLHRLDLARKTLQPVLDGEQDCAAGTSLIAAWLVDASIALARKHDSRAHSALTEALRLAEPQSVLRPFHDCGPQIRDLLVRSTGRFGVLEPFAERLRASFPRSESAASDMLTPRELELLVELPSWRTAEQIAADLCVSVNTVKTHLRGIYRKLGVTSRRDAIAAAQHNGLL